MEEKEEPFLRKNVEEANVFMALMNARGAEEEMPQTTNKLVSTARPACSPVFTQASPTTMR